MRGDLGKKVGASVAVAVTGGAMLLALGAVMGRLWLAAGGVACGLITLVVLRDRPIPDCPPPTWGERALALAGVGSQLGAVGLMWWALYWALRGVGSVVERVSGLDIDPRSIAFWLTLAWLGPVTLVAAGRAAGTMMRELYPATGLHSTYYDVLRFRRAELRRRLWIVLGGAALLALV